MDQKKKRLPKSLKQEELRQIKGGYRDVVSLSAGSQFIRWDEVDIRFGNDGDTSLGVNTNHVPAKRFHLGSVQK